MFVMTALLLYSAALFNFVRGSRRGGAGRERDYVPARMKLESLAEKPFSVQIDHVSEHCQASNSLPSSTLLLSRRTLPYNNRQHYQQDAEGSEGEKRRTSILRRPS